MKRSEQANYAAKKHAEYNAELTKDLGDQLHDLPVRIKLRLVREGYTNLTFGAFCALVRSKQFENMPGVGKKMIEGARSWIVEKAGLL